MDSPAGAYPSGKLGEEPRGKPGNLLPLLAQIAIGREKSDLKIFGNDYPTPYVFLHYLSLSHSLILTKTRSRARDNTLTHSDGTCVRDYLHVMDLAKGHVLSLDALSKNVSEGIFKSTDTSKSGYYRAFNLGKGKGMSVLDMINAMKKASGFDFQYEIVGRR